MKVRNLVEGSLARGPLTAALIAVLAVAGIAAPLTASAAAAPAIAATAPTTTVAPSTGATDTASSDATPSASASVVATVVATPVVVPVKHASRPAKLSVPQIITKVAHDARLSGSEIDALLWIAHHESNFHPTSKSSSGCYGLFQLSSSMVAGHPWKDPVWNTRRAIKYMKGRYHGVLNAKSFWQSHHWY